MHGGSHLSGYDRCTFTSLNCSDRKQQDDAFGCLRLQCCS